MSSKFLITGASGCIGSWVQRVLLDRGIDFIATDLEINTARTRLLLTKEELAGIEYASLDVTDTHAVADMVATQNITHIVHLAGLQIPFAKANPPLGAAVNVQGTVNIFEAARNANVTGIAYASSAAVFGPADRYPNDRIMDDAPRLPETLYGVYKTADEDIARIYWQDWQIGSVGLRPAVVFGVGRDQGLTSDISKAILAAAANEAFEIRFSGLITLQLAKDVAAIFIEAALCNHQGSITCNLRNDVIEVSDFVNLLHDVKPNSKVSYLKNMPLPFPADYDDSNLQSILSASVPHTPLRDAISENLDHYSRLLPDQNLLDQLTS